MSNNLYVNINGEKTEFRPISSKEIPNFAAGETIESMRLGGEATFSVKSDGSLERFIEQMQNELSTVDITNWPAWAIKELISAIPRTERLITRNPDHYFALQMEEGFACVAGGYDTLYDLPLILDKKGKIRAATVEFERKGGGNDE